MKKEALINITLDDLTNDQREFAEIIGLDKYKKLVDCFGGTYVYIPQQNAFERSVRNEQIREEFNGSNYDYLARKYNLTSTSIRTIVKDISTRIRSGVCENQMSIDDLLT